MGILPEEAEAAEASALMSMMRPKAINQSYANPADLMSKLGPQGVLPNSAPEAVRPGMSGGDPSYWSQQAREKERVQAAKTDPEYKRRLKAIAKMEAAEAAKKEKAKAEKVAAQEQAEQQAMFDSATGVTTQPTNNRKVPVASATEANINEALNSTPAAIVKEKLARIKADQLARGAKEGVSGSQNNFVTNEMNQDFIRQVLEAQDAFEVGHFDKYQTVPLLESLREKYQTELDGLEGVKDKTPELLSMLAAVGYDPTKTDISKIYKYTAGEERKSLQDKIRQVVNDQSKAMGDNSKFLASMYSAQRLPNTNFASNASRGSYTAETGRGTGKGGSGGGKPPTEKALEDYGLAFAKLQKTVAAEKRILALADNIDMDVVNTYAISGTGASVLNRIKSYGGKKNAAKAQATEEAISILADIMLNNQLELSGKAATDKEQARIMISSGISAGSTDGGAKNGIKNIFNDFKRQLATPLAGRSSNLKNTFDNESGINSTQQVQDALSGISSDRIQQVETPPGIVNDGKTTTPAPSGDLFGAGASDWLKQHRAKKGKPQ